MKRRESIGRSKSAAAEIVPVSAVVLGEVGLSEWDRVRPSGVQKGGEVGVPGEVAALRLLRSRVKWFWV